MCTQGYVWLFYPVMPPHIPPSSGTLDDCKEWDPGPIHKEEASSASDVNSLWHAALNEYGRVIGVDLRDQSVPHIRELEECSSTDDILNTLQGCGIP